MVIRCSPCLYKSPKTLFIVANVIYVLAGLVMLAIGIVAKVNPGFMVSMVENTLKTLKISHAFDLEGIITYSAIVMIILGTVLAVLGFFGCYGAWSEKRALLLAYIVALSVILCIELALIIVAVVAPENYKDLMRKSISEFRQDATFESGVLKLPHDIVSLSWSKLQIWANCCGAYGYNDYANRSHNVTIDGTIRSAAVPISCCAKNNSIKLISSGSYNISIFIDLSACLDGNPAYINQMNCYDSAVEIITQSEKKIARTSIYLIIGEQLLLIILAVGMCCKNPNDEERTKLVQDVQDGIDNVVEIAEQILALVQF